MGQEAISGLVTVALAIVGVAVIATLVSKNANTAGVLTAGGQSLATGITAAVSPVTAVQSIGWTGGAPVDLASY